VTPGALRALVWLGLVLLSLLVVWLLSAILLPFIAGFILAYFLDPLVDRLEAWRVPRWLGTLAVLLLAFLAVVLVLLLLVPLLEAQLGELIRRIPRFVELAQRLLDRLTQTLHEEVSPEDLARLRDAVGGRVGDLLGWLARLLQGALTSSVALVNILSLLFITPVVTFFLLRDWDRLVARIDSWIPRPHVETVREQARLIDETLAGFIRGQGSVCLALGGFYAIALSAAGLDFGLVIGFLSGLLTFIPFFGAMVGMGLSVGLALTQFDEWSRVALVALIFVIGQTLEGNLLTPKLVGERVNLHPVWLMFALLAFGALFGFVGVLLAVPLAAVSGVLVRFALQRYLQSTIYDPGRGARRPPPLRPPSDLPPI
jgi:predicted PurR-regulated permease PerM